MHTSTYTASEGTQRKPKNAIDTDETELVNCNLRSTSRALLKVSIMRRDTWRETAAGNDFPV